MAAIETREKVAELGDKYKYGFVTDIEMERAPKGLSEDTVKYISAKKGEPDWMLEWRLGAFARWKEMREPNWARVHYPKIDYQDAYYYAAPKNTPKPVVDRLYAEIRKAVATPSVKERITKDAGVPMDMALGDIEPLEKAEIAKWADVVKRAHIQVQ